MKFLLDTNVVSEPRRRSPNANVLVWLRHTDPVALFISVLTLGEIARGAEGMSRRDPPAGQSLAVWLDGLRRHYADRLIAIDAAVAETWGHLSTIRSLPVIDGLLVATAVTYGMTLVTRNVRDVTGTGVAVLNPWDI